MEEAEGQDPGQRHSPASPSPHEGGRLGVEVLHGVPQYGASSSIPQQCEVGRLGRRQDVCVIGERRSRGAPAHGPSKQCQAML